MLEVPDAGEDERHTILVAARDGVLVLLTASWLGDDADAVLARLLDGIIPGKRKEGVAGQCSSLGLLSCLPEGDSDALSPVRLTTAHSQHAVVLGYHNRIALDMFCAKPGKFGIGKLVFLRRPLRLCGKR
uniref:Uncharacterized protein n=1 Tax=Zea mays TaxID=4577 RepID=C0PNB8_MAIZE|nr:unknown [Zea mays]